MVHRKFAVDYEESGFQWRQVRLKMAALTAFLGIARGTCRLGNVTPNQKVDSVRAGPHFSEVAGHL